MYEYVKTEILRFFVLLIVISLLGYASGQWFLIALSVLTGYVLWHIRQLYYLERWMLGFDSGATQHLTGIWKYISETIARYQKTGRKRKRRISRLLQRFNRTLEFLPDAIVVLNSKMKIEWLNAAAEQLLGLTRKDIGEKIYEKIQSSSFQKFVRKGEFDKPLECISPQNAGLELEINIKLFGDGQYLLTAHDITEVKKVESIRREFLANVSHELRTPLTVISGYLELLEQEDMDPQVKQGIIASSRQAVRMQTLVSDLLMLSKLELHDNAQLIEETVNITTLLEALREDAIRLSDSARHNIHLHTDKHLGMKGNEAELSSAFGNLIFNAVLHTPAATDINVYWLKTGNNLEIRVEDNGPGIEPEHLARLTERFYRVDKARSRERGGTGLGLSITRHVVQRHDGEIKIESAVGKGTTFTCQFPLERAITIQQAENVMLANE